MIASGELVIGDELRTLLPPRPRRRSVALPLIAIAIDLGVGGVDKVRGVEGSRWGMVLLNHEEVGTRHLRLIEPTAVAIVIAKATVSPYPIREGGVFVTWNHLKVACLRRDSWHTSMVWRGLASFS